jgi:hypothetical protein
MQCSAPARHICTFDLRPRAVSSPINAGIFDGTMAGTPSRSKEIFKLLFVEQYGVETVVPSLRAAAAWLALRHPDIRSEVIKREPVSLIQQSDPAGLPSEAKAALLLRFATRHAKGDISDANMDRRAISLFASADLADIIRKVWTTNPRPDFRADLVRLIREGRIFICADLANVMARDKTLRDYHRILAVQALVACGATQELSQLTELLMREAHLASPRLAAEFAQALFPKHLTLPQLLVLIERSKQPRNFSAEGFAHVIDDLWSACPLTLRSDFIAGVGELCAEEPFVHDYQRVAGRHQELAKRLGRIARVAVITLGDADPPFALFRLLAGALRRRASVVSPASRPAMVAR